MENGNGAKAAQDVMLLVPAALAQGILNYLQERPFKEVQGLITELVKCGVPHECRSVCCVPWQSCARHPSVATLPSPPRELTAATEDV
jgi:hypothetical protein